MKDRWIFPAACLSAAVAIAAGAFGAHAAHGAGADWLKTGGLYQLIHATAVVAISGRYSGPAKLLLAGSLVFSLTLYGMALGAPLWLGAITPIGGIAMIGGWLWAAYLGWSSRNPRTSVNSTDLST